MWAELDAPDTQSDYKGVCVAGGQSFNALTSTPPPSSSMGSPTLLSEPLQFKVFLGVPFHSVKTAGIPALE